MPITTSPAKFKAGNVVKHKDYPNEYVVGRVNKSTEMYTLFRYDPTQPKGKGSRYGKLPFDKEELWSVVQEKSSGTA